MYKIIHKDETHHLEIIKKSGKIYLRHRKEVFLEIEPTGYGFDVLKKMYNAIVNNHHQIKEYFEETFYV